jgi:MFS family permease
VSLTNNPRRLVAFAGLQFILFPIPIITLFWKDQIGMSITDIMVLQAVFGATVALVQFPSGYFADRVGYRASMLVGTGLGVTGWVVYLHGASFAGITAAEILLGAGSAFTSGADRALLWVSLDAGGEGARYTRWEGRARAAAQTGEAMSAAAGGWLYTADPRLPFRFQIAAAAVTLASVLALREGPRASSAGTRSHARRALSVVRFTLWHHRRLQAALLLGVVLGLASFVMVWLIQPVMQARGIPPAWFGPLWAGAHLWLAAVSLASARVVTALGVRGALLACCLLVPLGYGGLAATSSAWGVAFYLCFMTLRGLAGPILVTVMQAEAPSEDRASVLSLATLLFRLAFVVAGPLIGALVDHAGMRIALAALAVVFTVTSVAGLGLFARAPVRPA